jgi:hypothetical protein
VTLAEANRILEERGDEGLLLEEIAEILIAQIQAMTPDEKAHLRAQIDKRMGIAPKSSGGKPS